MLSYQCKWLQWVVEMETCCTIREPHGRITDVNVLYIERTSFN